MQLSQLVEAVASCAFELSCAGSARNFLSALRPAAGPHDSAVIRIPDVRARPPPWRAARRMLSLAIRGDAYKLAGSEPSSLLTRGWRKPDSNFWSLKSIQLGDVNARRHGGHIRSSLFSTRISHKSGARQYYHSRATTSLSGSADQLQA